MSFTFINIQLKSIMKIFFLVVIVTLSSLIVFSENRVKIDSLLRLSKQTKNDSVKAYIYIQISDEYWADDPQNCKKYATFALPMAQKRNLHGLLYHAYLNLACACAWKGKINEALYYDRLSFKEAVLSGRDKLIMRICLNFGNDLTIDSKFDSANLMLDMGIRIAKKYDDKAELCQLFLNKANNLFYEGKLDSAEIYYCSGLKNAVVLRDTGAMAMFYNNIASVRLYRGISDSVVIDYLMRAVSFDEKMKDYGNLGDCYNTLASAYNVRGNNEKAIHYLKKGIESLKMANNEIKTVTLLVNVAEQYRDLKSMDSAALYADMAIEMGERNHFKRGLAAAYSIKGEILSAKRNYELAGRYLKKAYAEFSEANDAEGILFSGNNLAIALNTQNKTEEARKIATEVFNLAVTVKNYLAIKTSALTLSEIFHKTGNDSKAYDYQKFYIAAVDTINKRQNTRLLEEMVAKYEAEKKDKVILMLSNDKLIKEAKIIQQSERIFQAAAIAGIFLLIAVVMLFINQRKKIKYKLQIQKMELKFLRSQLKPHFICNALLAIRNFIRHDAVMAEEYLDKYSALMREVLENTEEETITLEEEFSMLKKYMDLESLRVNNGFSYDLTVDPALDTDALKVPPLILQPIVENAIWHGIAGRSEKGNISIHVTQEKTTLQCIVENHCTGIKTVDLESKKTRKSFGLKISRERLNLLSKERRGNWHLDLIPAADGMRVSLGIPI
jgi:tetratricopeptide (TPR) repeat protein